MRVTRKLDDGTVEPFGDDGIEIVRIPKGEFICALPLLDSKYAPTDSLSRASGLMWVGLLVVVGVLAVGALLVGG